MLTRTGFLASSEPSCPPPPAAACVQRGTNPTLPLPQGMCKGSAGHLKGSWQAQTAGGPGATRGCASPAGSAPAGNPPCSQNAGFLAGPYGLWPGRPCGHPFPWLSQSPRLGLEPSLASCPAQRGCRGLAWQEAELEALKAACFCLCQGGGDAAGILTPPPLHRSEPAAWAARTQPPLRWDQLRAWGQERAEGNPRVPGPGEVPGDSVKSLGEEVVQCEKLPIEITRTHHPATRSCAGVWGCHKAPGFLVPS